MLLKTRLPPNKVPGSLVDFRVFKDINFLLYCCGTFFIMFGLYLPMFYLVCSHCLGLTSKHLLIFCVCSNFTLRAKAYQILYHFTCSLFSVGIRFHVRMCIDSLVCEYRCRKFVWTNNVCDLVLNILALIDNLTSLDLQSELLG
jgi:hypothetical protein